MLIITDEKRIVKRIQVRFSANKKKPEGSLFLVLPAGFSLFDLLFSAFLEAEAVATGAVGTIRRDFHLTERTVFTFAVVLARVYVALNAFVNHFFTSLFLLLCSNGHLL